LAAARRSDLVSVEAGTYNETVLIDDTRITIQGAGAGATTIAGLVYLTQSTATISGVTILGGKVVVRIDSSLTLRDSIVSGSPGHGVELVDKHRVVIERSSITGSAHAGVYVCCRGSVSIVDSTISGNQAGGVVAAGNNSRAKVTVVGSTISGNSTAGSGGGIRTANGGANLKVIRSTISGNTASGDGGGIYLNANEFRRSTLRLESSTVAGNSAAISGGTGGIVSEFGGGTGNFVRIDNSIVADNLSDAAPDCRLEAGGLSTVGTTSLIETPCPEPPTLSGGAALLSGDPVLAPLADNGGPTETHALLAGSPALAAQTKGALCKVPDQRGVTRIAPCDLGAYELP